MRSPLEKIQRCGKEFLSMKQLIGYSLLLVLLAAGCVSKSAANAKARAAYIAGEKQGEAKEVNATTVWIVGNVRTPVIPWTDDLTLVKALIQAEYLGQGDPSQISVVRAGQQPIYVNARQLFDGFDMALEPGDRVEVRR
jgi:hypothetical protein